MADNSIGSRLKLLRATNHYTVSYVSEQTGMRYATIHKHESNETEALTVSMLMKYVELYKCNIVWLLTGEKCACATCPTKAKVGEIALEEYYRSLNEAGQSLLLSVAAALAKSTVTSVSGEDVQEDIQWLKGRNRDYTGQK